MKELINEKHTNINNKIREYNILYLLEIKY